MKNPVLTSLKDGRDYPKRVYRSVLKEQGLSSSYGALLKYERNGWVEEPRRAPNGWRLYTKEEMIKNIDNIRNYNRKRGGE